MAATGVVVWEYDPTLDPRRHDVGVSPEGEHAAIAILLYPGLGGGGAYAFGTESYTHENFRKPEWRLEHGTYRVRVVVTGSDVRCERAFKLEYIDEDFARFVLRSA